VSFQDQVSAATGGIGVVLVLVSLFTSEQARGNDAERTRVGGPQRDTTRTTYLLSASLTVVTLVALFALAPLGIKILESCCAGAWQPAEAIFLLMWGLLLPLLLWQLAIAKVAARHRREAIS
jgi:hypothetical protein